MEIVHSKGVKVKNHIQCLGNMDGPDGLKDRGSRKVVGGKTAEVLTGLNTKLVDGGFIDST